MLSAILHGWKLCVLRGGMVENSNLNNLISLAVALRVCLRLLCRAALIFLRLLYRKQITEDVIVC
jgi:hypothetical protein